MSETVTSAKPSHLLPQVLDLAGAEPLLLWMRDLLGREKTVSLDGSQVERISTACIQVILAACQAARAHDVTFTLMTPSSVLLDALRDLGLSSAMPIVERA